jgi:hypothetical protein
MDSTARCVTTVKVEVAMSIAKNFEYDCENLLVDEESWTCFLEPAFHEHPNAAESLAEVLFAVKEALGRGPKGVMQASDTLMDGLSLIYLYTDHHKAACKLYLLSLTGYLKPSDEPRQLLSGAIERATVEIKRVAAAKRLSKDPRADRRQIAKRNRP